MPDLYVVDAQGGTEARRIYANPNTKYTTDLSPDGRFVLFVERDGEELFYVSGTHDLMAVPVDMDSDSDPVGTPRELFSPRLRRAYFEASPDGQRFLLLQRLDPEIAAITLIQNWTAHPGD